MITSVHSATIFVTDQDRALDFYVNKLGFEKQADQPMGPDSATSSSITDDLQATHRDLSAKGVAFPTPPEQQPWGWWAVVAPDPSRMYHRVRGHPR